MVVESGSLVPLGDSIRAGGSITATVSKNKEQSKLKWPASVLLVQGHNCSAVIDKAEKRHRGKSTVEDAVEIQVLNCHLLDPE